MIARQSGQYFEAKENSYEHGALELVLVNEDNSFAFGNPEISLHAVAKLLNSYLPPPLKDDELYAGIVLGKDGQPNHHLILLPAKSKRLAWGKATEWAAESGGELPSRREQSILFGNLKEEFESAWYWSGEQSAANPDYAWMQGFDDGGQYYGHTSDEYRARAVRRILIIE